APPRYGWLGSSENHCAHCAFYSFLHDALPISIHEERHAVATDAGARDRALREDRRAVVRAARAEVRLARERDRCRALAERPEERDRKSTRLNSSHVSISYADFCLTKNTLTTNT